MMLVGAAIVMTLNNSIASALDPSAYQDISCVTHKPANVPSSLTAQVTEAEAEPQPVVMSAGTEQNNSQNESEASGNDGASNGSVASNITVEAYQDNYSAEPSNVAIVTSSVYGNTGYEAESYTSEPVIESEPMYAGYPDATDDQIYRYPIAANGTGTFIGTMYFQNGTSVDLYQYSMYSPDYSQISGQQICDEDNSAIYVPANVGIIGDHNYQGLNYIYDMQYGETIDVKLANGNVLTYVCTGVDRNSFNEGDYLQDSNGVTSNDAGEDLWLYTCNVPSNGGYNITIAKFVAA